VRVLVVEDDALIARGIVAGLRGQDITADAVATVAQAETALATSHCDALVLDLGLPDSDGMTLLRRLRASGSMLPILVLTARDAVEDRVAGLQAGADDYVLKPFDLAELGARLHALTRRADGRSVNMLTVGELRLDPASGDVWHGGEKVALTRRETALLASLMRADGRCLSAEQLKDSLYGFDLEVESNALSVHIHNLRRKLGVDTIETVRGLGYRIGGRS
jgi:DNA-binding response OmpR family regulator